MSDLSQLLVGETRPALVNDLAAFVEQAVSEQSGITGMAIKGGVGAARKVKSDIIPAGVNRMLPEMLGEMQPYWEQFRASGQEDFGAFVAPQSEGVSDALLNVADKHAETVGVPALQRSLLQAACVAGAGGLVDASLRGLSCAPVGASGSSAGYRSREAAARRGVEVVRRGVTRVGRGSAAGRARPEARLSISRSTCE